MRPETGGRPRFGRMAETLVTGDRAEAMIGQARPLLDRLIAKEETLGVGLLGGLARGGLREFADVHSDVDVTLLVTCDLPPEIRSLKRPQAMAAAQAHAPAWLPNFKFTDPESGLEFNIHQHILEFEIQPHVIWDRDKCSAYGDNLQILYDPAGSLADLVRRKTGDRDQRAYLACLTLLSASRQLVRSDVPKALARGRPDVAGDLITRVVHETVDAVFFLHGIWPPGHKWKRLTLESLMPSDGFPSSSRDALLGLMAWPRNEPDCRASRDTLLHLLGTLEDLARGTFHDWPDDPYGHAVATLGEKQIRRITGADETVGGAGGSYRCRQAEQRWNQANARLESSSGTSEPRRNPRERRVPSTAPSFADAAAGLDQAG